MIIDSHQHFWQYNPSKHGWISPEMQVLRQNFMPKNLKPILEKHRVDGCIAVQADQSEEETEFLLGLAVENDFIKGVVGWLDLCSTTIGNRLEHFSKNPYLKGLRHIVQDEPDDNFMLRDDFQKGIAQLERFGLTYDILVYPKQLTAALELVKTFPKQPFIIDHIAKPNMQHGVDDHWRSHIEAMGQQQNVFCKISGLVTETDWGNWSKPDFTPFLDIVFDAFGPDRILFGSDWPVCLLSANYSEVKDIAESYIAKLDSEIQQKIMGENAMAFYNLSV